MLGNYNPVSLDPSAAYDSAAWNILHLLGDGLLAFKPVGGVSAQLVPDLAKSIPMPTDGGLRYTFDLRPEIPYSNGETVAAVDFRRGIERVFLLEPDFAALFHGLIGAEACQDEPRTCDLSQGIETDEGRDGTTITFNLSNLTRSSCTSSPRPRPFRFHPPSRTQSRSWRGVPGTGPYILEGPMTGEGLTLVRNPRFRVWSAAAQPDGYVDRIEWTFGVDRGSSGGRSHREADLTYDAADSDDSKALRSVRVAGPHVSQRPDAVHRAGY